MTRDDNNNLLVARAQLTIRFTHCTTDQELNCKHDFIDCPHHPLGWEESQISGDVRRFKPVYYNTPPRPHVPWYEKDNW